MPASIGDDWTVGDLIDPLPKEAKYQNCQLRIRPRDKKSAPEKLVMMGDGTYLVLFKIDFTDMEHIKGELVLKIGYRDVITVDVHRSDATRLKV